MRGKGILFIGALLLLNGCGSPGTAQDQPGSLGSVSGALSAPTPLGVVVDSDPEAKKQKAKHYDYLPEEVVAQFLLNEKSTVGSMGVDPDGLQALAEEGPVGTFEPIYGEFGQLVELRGTLVHLPPPKNAKTPQAAAETFLAGLKPALRLSPDTALTFKGIREVSALCANMNETATPERLV